MRVVWCCLTWWAIAAVCSFAQRLLALQRSRASHPDRRPEKSKQFSAGFVDEASREWSGSVDYWSIRKSDIISEIGEETISSNPIYYNDPSIVSRSSGFVDVITVRKENRGKLNTSGLDVAVNWRGGQTGMGRFGVGIAGTYVTEYKSRPTRVRRWSTAWAASATTRRCSAGATRPTSTGTWAMSA